MHHRARPAALLQRPGRLDSLFVHPAGSSGGNQRRQRYRTEHGSQTDSNKLIVFNFSKGASNMKQFIRTTTRFSLRLFLLAGLLAGMLGVKGNLPAHAAGAYYLIPFIDCLWNNLDEPYLNPSVCNPTIQLTPNQTHVFNVIAEGLAPFYRALPGLTVNWGFLGPVGGTFRSSQTVTNYPNGDSANDFTAGMTPGYYVIQGSTSDGNIAQFSINIAAPVVLESIDVTPINPSLQTGLTQQFTATGAFSDGSTQDLTAAATWSSSNQSVATISNATSSNGLATV